MEHNHLDITLPSASSTVSDIVPMAPSSVTLTSTQHATLEQSRVLTLASISELESYQASAEYTYLNVIRFLQLPPESPVNIIESEIIAYDLFGQVLVDFLNVYLRSIKWWTKLTFICSTWFLLLGGITFSASVFGIHGPV